MQEALGGALCGNLRVETRVGFLWRGSGFMVRFLASLRGLRTLVQQRPLGVEQTFLLAFRGEGAVFCGREITAILDELAFHLARE